MTRDELIAELARRYGMSKFYSRYFSDAEIVYHRDTGFSIGLVKHKSKEAYLSDEGALQSTYRIDGGSNDQ